MPTINIGEFIGYIYESANPFFKGVFSIGMIFLGISLFGLIIYEIVSIINDQLDKFDSESNAEYETDMMAWFETKYGDRYGEKEFRNWFLNRHKPRESDYYR